MLKIEMLMTIITLWKSGKSKSEISRLVERDRKTVRKIIQNYEARGDCIVERKQRFSMVEPYKDQIIKYLEQNLSAMKSYACKV